MFFRDEMGALKISSFIAFWLRDPKKIPNFRRSQKRDSPRPPFNLWNQKNLANKEIFHLLFFHFHSAGKRKMCDSLPDHDFVDWYGKSAKQSMNWSCEYFCCSRYSNTVFHYVLTRLFPKILLIELCGSMAKAFYCGNSSSLRFESSFRSGGVIRGVAMATPFFYFVWSVLKLVAWDVILFKVSFSDL